MNLPTIPYSGLIVGTVEWVKAVRAHAGNNQDVIQLCDLLQQARDNVLKRQLQIVELTRQLEGIRGVLKHATSQLARTQRAVCVAVDMCTEDKGGQDGSEEARATRTSNER